MSQTTRYSGANLHIAWIWSGGTTTLTGDQRTLTTNEDVGDIDSTAGADTYQGHLPNTTNAKATLQVLDLNGTNGTAIWASLAPRNSGTLIWGTDGTTATYPKMTGTAYVSSRARAHPYNDVTAITAGFQFQAVLTAGTYP